MSIVERHRQSITLEKSVYAENLTVILLIFIPWNIPDYSLWKSTH
uniref:Uncharacterized protein n=1 Tax=Tetranychus urticae TaxID=32264 RepID=A0A158P4T4_TETUR